MTSYGSYERFDWINTPCCPPNVVRLLASLGNYIYAKNRADSDVYVNLFIGSTAAFPLGGGTLRLRRRRLSVGRPRPDPVDPERAQRFTVNVRIPGWTKNEVIPGNLYRFLDQDALPSRSR